MSVELAIYAADTVATALDYPTLVERLRSAFIDASAGRASSPPRVAALVPEQNAYLGAMPVYLPAAGVLGSKLVSVFPGVAPRLPTHHAVFVAFDPSTGVPTALLDASVITERRTAAASALATELLAPRDAQILAIFGTGVQARAHAQALAHVRPWSQVRIWGRRLDAAESLAVDFAEVRELASARIDVVRHAHEALLDADVACFATHSDRPIVPAEAIPAGCHVISVGVNPAGPEVPPELVQRARVVVELRSAALAPPPGGAPDLQQALASGWLVPDEVTELGELLAGVRPGRVAPDETTFYRSVGVAVEDAAAVALVIERSLPSATVRL